MTRWKKAWLACGGACALLLLVSIVFVLLAGSGLARERLVLRQGYRRLDALLARDPFPSPGNAERLRGDLDRLEYLAGELVAALSPVPVPQEAVDAAGFSSRAQAAVERFRRNARQAGVGLPPALEGGFARYASGGAVPEAAHVPRLSRQLHAVECVADVLVRAKVDAITGLGRDEFDAPDRTGSAAGTGQRRSRRAPPGGLLREPGTAGGAEGGAGAFWATERITASFRAGEGSVWRVLDGFAAAGRFMVVAGFSHAAETAILAYDPEALKDGDTEDETLRYLAEGILVGKQALSRPERIIAGGEPVRVDLLVDVYFFDPPGDGGTP